MNKFTKEMIDSYADKLLIGLTDEEKDMITLEFDSIDKSIQSVLEIPNLSEVEPMTHTLDDFVYELREDEPEESVLIDDLLKNSGDEDGAYIVVPKVVG